jgi:hypothetical protein
LGELAFVPTAEWVGEWVARRVGGFFSLTGVYLLLAVCAKCFILQHTAIMLVAGKCVHILCIGKVNSALFVLCD